MDIVRRGYMQATRIDAVSDDLNRLAFDPMPIRAYASDLEFEAVREVGSICSLCPEGCRYIVHVRDGKVVSAEVDPSNPVNEGELCKMGAAALAKIAVAAND